MTRSILATALALLLLSACSTSNDESDFDNSGLTVEGIAAAAQSLGIEPANDGLGLAFGCSTAIRSARETYGEPEDTFTSRSDGLSVQTLYWWSQGRSNTYVSTEGGGCDVTRNTFARP